MHVRVVFVGVCEVRGRGHSLHDIVLIHLPIEHKLFQNGRLHSKNTIFVPFHKLHLQPTSLQCAVLTFLFLIASLANCRLLTHSANASWATPSNTGFCNENHISINLLSTTAPNNLTHSLSCKIVYSILKTCLVTSHANKWCFLNGTISRSNQGYTQLNNHPIRSGLLHRYESSDGVE